MLCVATLCTCVAAPDGVTCLTPEAMAATVGTGVWWHACHKHMDCESSCISGFETVWYKWDPLSYMAFGLKIGLPGEWDDATVVCEMKFYTDAACTHRDGQEPVKDTRDACIPTDPED